MNQIKILFIGPKHGGIGWYIKQLRQRLGDSPFIKKIDWYGYSFLTFDLEKISKIKKEILSLNINEYDIIHFEFGTYDVEQIALPILISKKTNKNKFIITIHNNDWELANKIKSHSLKFLLYKSLQSVDGFIFFGKYPFKILKTKFSFIKKQNSIISLHPSTYENFKIDSKAEKRILTKYGIQKPYLALFGYPAKWKDHKLLLMAFSRINTPISFYFIGKWWKEKLGFQQKIIGKVKIRVIEKEIPHRDFFVCIKNSLFGIFPYSPYLTFQCSGVLPVFINLGKAVVATKIATIFEYVGKAGKLVPNDDYIFGQAIEELINNSIKRHYLEKKAKEQSIKISWEQHIKKHLDFYKKIYDND